MVPPSIFPSSLKLGEERLSVSEEAVAGEGIFMEDYRRQKLLEYCMDATSKKYALSYPQIKILLYVSHTHVAVSRKELADFAGVSRSSLSFALKKLISKDYIKISELKKEEVEEGKITEAATGRKIDITILKDAMPVINEINVALSRYEHSIFEGFKEEEIVQYAMLEDKIKNNIQRILQ